MNKKYKFLGSSLELIANITAEVRICQTEGNNISLDFECDQSEALNIDYTETSLSIQTKDNFKPTSFDFKELVNYILKKGASNQNSIKANIVIYLPTDGNLSVKINSGQFLSETNINNLDLKINSGSVLIREKIGNMNIKINSGNVISTSSVKKIDMKVNSGNIELVANKDTLSWDIKANSGQIVISKNDFMGNLLAVVSGNEQKISGSDEGKIDIKMNSGFLNIK